MLTRRRDSGNSDPHADWHARAFVFGVIGLGFMLLGLANALLKGDGWGYLQAMLGLLFGVVAVGWYRKARPGKSPRVPERQSDAPVAVAMHDDKANWAARGWVYLVGCVAFALMAVLPPVRPDNLLGVLLHVVVGLVAVMWLGAAYYAWRWHRTPTWAEIRPGRHKAR
jgi:hypothetical protein